MYPAFYEMTLVLGHPDVPTSAHYVSQLLKLGVIKSMLTPPSILEDLSKDPAAVLDLANFKHVGYAGGPLQPDVGNTLAPILPHLFSFIGATEYGWFHNISGNNEKWESLNFCLNIGYRFDEVSEGMFELVIVNDEKTNKYHGIFETFPGIREYRTRDLYTSESQGWWRYRGRADDLIVLSNGEKINPIPMENIIRSHHSVKAALVIGEYRFNPSLLVEMEADFIPRTETEKHEALNKIWPTVQEANKIAPGYAKIPKSLILFAYAEKPFQRAGKGTVQRQNTVKVYSNELDQLFSEQELGLMTEGLTLRESPSPGNIRTFTREIYIQAMEMDDLKDSDNIFERGMDSLRVTVVAQRLRAALKFCEVSLAGATVDPRMVYSAPSINQMAEILINLAGQDEAVPMTNGTSLLQSRRKKMEDMFEKYAKDMPSPPSLGDVQKRLTNGSGFRSLKIVLTGTTGCLGSYLLAAFEALPKIHVAKIFCLNRSANSHEKQRKANLSRGLNASWDCERIQFLQADLSQPDLGLGRGKYNELLEEATLVIHCSWKVDFNLTIESFEPQIQGVRNLLEFSSRSVNKAPLVFISSISTVLGWLGSNPKAVVPETIIHDFDAPENVGYGESKYVSELLLERFSKSSAITTAVFRTGQIAGPLSSKGSWNKQEWFPSIMASSKYLKSLPTTLGNMEVIDWIPVDLLSAVMIELIPKILKQDHHAHGQTLIYNLVNPQATAWSSLLPSVQKLAGIPQVVPLKAWVEALEDSSRENHGAVTERNPAVKLLEFFRALCKKEVPVVAGSSYEVRGLVRDSRQASKLEAVSPEWMKLWMEQWNF
jgi:thioester reductase-like protein